MKLLRTRFERVSIDVTDIEHEDKVYTIKTYRNEAAKKTLEDVVTDWEGNDITDSELGELLLNFYKAN
jgi:hypothetical protein